MSDGLDKIPEVLDKWLVGDNAYHGLLSNVKSFLPVLAGFTLVHISLDLLTPGVA